MIAISCAEVGKKYGYRWVFKGFTYSFGAGGSYVIAGKNGSGKSTMIRMLSGHLTPNAGQIIWNTGKQRIDPDQIYQHVSITGPYVELPEEFTFPELIDFHRRLKGLPAGIETQDMMAISGLETSASKPIRHFSSGMKQRVRLCLALIPDSQLLLLDEPCSSLDAEARQWYREMLENHCHGKTIVVASNHYAEEYPSKHTIIEI